MDRYTSPYILKVQHHLVQLYVYFNKICCSVKGLWQVNFNALVIATSSMNIGSKVMLPLQVHTQVTPSTTNNISLLVPKASRQPIKVLMQLTRGFGLDVLPQLFGNSFLRQLPCLAFHSQVAFNSVGLAGCHSWQRLRKRLFIDYLSLHS